HRPACSGLVRRPAGPGTSPVRGGRAGARRWPTARYATVAAGLRSTGRRVVVTGGPGEEDLCAAVAAEAGLDARDVFAGSLTFGRFSALVAGAALFVSGDTGPAHLAFAHGTPSMTLFGPVAPGLWGPPPDPHHAVLWHPGPPGDPHADEPDPLLLRLDAPRVLEQALRSLGRGDHDGRAATHG
ncbi:glycosyltransferase family 9 protein, partial [Streptomyces sp. NPDC005892]|uniref:glycosyltransferase family 9 protein n=1 Tax=Streptomyces sp. NPDC005892 TaxID=3155593 RepID=UPI0033D4FF99